ncbi:hypothetical protein F4781DRAFT_188561 [Annulohypoxylon bovei var. microspora]|nr:hypothetical protein F4781DRAFT_188561 [Annulohypoxylon bovei var. microspora]
MDAIRTNVVHGVDHGNEIFQNNVVSQLISGQSIKALMTRSSGSRAITRAFVSIFLPIQTIIVILIFVSIEYTLYNIFQVLAIVEDDAPKSYEELANKDVVELEELLNEDRAALVDEGLAPRSKPITSSLRSIYRLLRSISGKRSLLRGIWCWIPLKLTTILIVFLLSQIPFVPIVIAWLIASLLTLPWYTAWMHIVITEPSNKYFWRRLPPFGLVFRAGGPPILAYSLIRGFEGGVVSTLISTSLDFDLYVNSLMDFVIYPVLALFIWTFIVIPVDAILIRILASLLPEEERTVVPLHRSIMLHRREGREYVSLRDAWRSFSRPTLVRLFKLSAKIFGFCLAVDSVMVVVVIAEWFIIIRFVRR